jgi:hypothetical protein
MTSVDLHEALCPDNSSSSDMLALNVPSTVDGSAREFFVSFTDEVYRSISTSDRMADSACRRVRRDAVIEDVMVIMARDEAAALRNYLQVTQPMGHGTVRNWEAWRTFETTLSSKIFTSIPRSARSSSPNYR